MAHGLLHFGQELLNANTRVLQSTFEGAAVNLVMKWEDNPSSVRMLQFHMATSSMLLDEAETLQGRQYLTTGK